LYPITAIEIVTATVFVIVLFVIAFLLPKRIRKFSLLAASSLTTIVLLFFAVRPFWIEYQAEKRMEYLNRYLEKKYPNEEWKIRRLEGVRYSPYHFDVEFKNEKGWIYRYSVGGEQEICQNAWALPDGIRPAEGKHYESGCE